MTAEAVETMISVNLHGTIRVLQATLPSVNDGGSIIIMSSTSGLQAHPGGAVYAATKDGTHRSRPGPLAVEVVVDKNSSKRDLSGCRRTQR